MSLTCVCSFLSSVLLLSCVPEQFFFPICMGFVLLGPLTPLTLSNPTSSLSFSLSPSPGSEKCLCWVQPPGAAWVLQQGLSLSVCGAYCACLCPLSCHPVCALLCFSAYLPHCTSSWMADIFWQNPSSCVSSPCSDTFCCTRFPPFRCLFHFLLFSLCVCVSVCACVFLKNSTVSSLSSSLKSYKASWILWLDACCSLYSHTHTHNTHTLLVFSLTAMPAARSLAITFSLWFITHKCQNLQAVVSFLYELHSIQVCHHNLERTEW